MKSVFRVTLQPTAEQYARLRALQVTFAQVCNTLAPVARQTRVWNRVALHHLTYRELREQFPALGSQMVCNAIYSVSRACRAIYQSPTSPFCVARLGAAQLPLLRFSDDSPVFFDRHTLSLKAGKLSLFTLDGRMRFHLSLKPDEEAAFHGRKLREIVLRRRGKDSFELVFWLDQAATEPVPLAAHGAPVDQAPDEVEIPDYVTVEELA